MLPLVVLSLVAALSGCPSKKPQYPTCNSDKDCKESEKCVNRHCVQCAADPDCGEGQRCVEGGCEDIEGYCTTDGDCRDGKVCNDQHQCVPCTANSECGEGGRCVDGGCLRKGQCRGDDDCAEDEDCVKGVCSKASPSGDGLPSCALKLVPFDYDTAALREDAKAALQSNADCLSTSPRGVAVIGMTDPRGTDEYNIALSDERARAAADYLGRLGVDSSRLRIVPKGESEATGTDEAGWAHDRRVELSWE